MECWEVRMIRVIGMGPGSLKYVTPEAMEKIKAADRVLAFGRIAETALQIRPDVQRVNRVEELLMQLDPQKDVAVLASGDPCFYGIVETLQKKEVQIEEVIPGLSSVQYMMSKLKMSWQDAALSSFHGREGSLETIRSHKRTIVLTDNKYTPDKISRLLWENGIRGSITAGFDLSYPTEHIIRKRIGEAIEEERTLAVVVIENEMA
jgi:cobalt-precorrin-7 (C5)-methyltransferase